MSSEPKSASETICAIATPPGAGGLGIVRVSGPLVRSIAQRLLGSLPQPRYATLKDFPLESGEIIDSGIVLFFPAPASFTGEDVLELQGHGGPMVLQQLMRRVLELGARAARPGEFSERAFLHDKIDLTQAEAIADLIESSTFAAAQAAQRSLQGVFSRRVNGLQASLTKLRVFVEASIDFPDEEIDFLAESDVLQHLQQTELEMEELFNEALQGRLLRDGVVLAIIGRPNAGKSSLLNALAGQDRAIVTEIPGTTRDVLHERIELDGIPVHLADTAGIRETSDQIEVEGVRRARQALATADIAVILEDASAENHDIDDLAAELPAGVVGIRVANKVDLDVSAYRRLISQGAAGPDVWISAKTGQGMDDLRSRIRQSIGVADHAGGSFSARQRHIDALERAGCHLSAGKRQLQEFRAGELLAEELRLAQQALGEITGEFIADDLLAEIFSSFCIGK